MVMAAAFSCFVLVARGDHCNLNLVPGCTDPSSSSYDPLANVDDGTCPIELDSDSD
ncbi:unnamed protein product [Prunus armeniaca]|uniref:Uncharacterized protein n=1 Tax=Prunus armeniaca TaxID=36596 RepID=A0A6J5UF24_PRUAR|nr:unnamed protein product [Prunus armeniaca]CAB4303378.1 unnamed protein product [Prunus armeniaca]